MDSEYTDDDALPVVGGSEEDLKHLKRLDSRTGSEVDANGNIQAVRRRLNHGGTTSILAPLSARFGFILQF